MYKLAYKGLPSYTEIIGLGIFRNSGSSPFFMGCSV